MIDKCVLLSVIIYERIDICDYPCFKITLSSCRFVGACIFQTSDHCCLHELVVPWSAKL